MRSYSLSIGIFSLDLLMWWCHDSGIDWEYPVCLIFLEYGAMFSVFLSSSKWSIVSDFSLSDLDLHRYWLLCTFFDYWLLCPPHCGHRRPVIDGYAEHWTEKFHQETKLISMFLLVQWCFSVFDMFCYVWTLSLVWILIYLAPSAKIEVVIQVRCCFVVKHTEHIQYSAKASNGLIFAPSYVWPQILQTHCTTQHFPKKRFSNFWLQFENMPLDDCKPGMFQEPFFRWLRDRSCHTAKSHHFHGRR